MSSAGMLAPYRVLDLTDGRAEIATFMLAGLGADVIKVEPPGGAASRRQAPLADGEPAELASLRFQAYNRGKRSIALDVQDSTGRADFEALVASADFVFENAGAGVAEAAGHGFDALRQLQPELVYVAISPFGQDGPYADHLSTDLTVAAMGGSVALTGDPDRRPVRISVPQTWLHGSAEAALASLVAHERRLATGEAQFVDMSVQAAVFWTGLNAMVKSAIDGANAERCGTELHLTTLKTPLAYPAADGEVCMIAIGKTLQGVVPWMLETGIVDQAWVDGEDWETYERRHLDGVDMHHTFEHVIDTVRRFTSSMTKNELFRGATERGFTIVPVSTAQDVLAMDQLEVRDYWDEITLPSGRTLRAPGAFAKSSIAPIQWARPAPKIGEHTEELLAELTAASPRQPIERVRPERGLPLEGIKVADFSWIGVGPISAKALADHGATVVRIESDDPADRLRLVGPFKDNEIGINRCQFYGSFNTSKQSIHLNLKHPDGLEVARKMLAWCDISLNSFVAGSMDRLGLGYDVARKLNPNIIMAETCLFGQTGPIASLAGYGYHAAAISGFYEVTGWPDRPPGGPWNAYTDTVAPRFLVTTLLAALDHRRRTGEGQHIDLAQAEAALHFLAPQLIDTQLTGVSPRRRGNADPDHAPHDVYPCAGDDQWCAIAIETDEQWTRLRSVLGDPDWATSDLDSHAGRRAAAETIDEHLGAYTRQHEPRALLEQLQAAGVPAGMVQRSSDLLEDPQFAHRNFYRPMTHPEMGEVPYEGHQYRIAGYDNGPRAPAPCLGEHTFDVLTEHLDLDMDEAVAILSSGATG
jgi:crotonobetainyl-CoA:carnitine CoA-transferase CaiB-like acyl-CoA transferase